MPAGESPERERLGFDRDWRFKRGEVERGQSPDLDDTSWRQLDLPHDWSAELGFDPAQASGTAYLPGGIGWYRKRFDAPAGWAGRRVQLVFDGVYRNSKVWLNGKRVGGRPSGYTPVVMELTPHLRLSEQNVVAVRVERENTADSRWYPGSGIYRHTWLNVTGPVHVARHGTFVTTPRVTATRADVCVSSEVRNRTAAAVRVGVVTTLVSPGGTELSRQSSSRSIEPGATETAAHWHVVDEPSLWAPESPELYSVVTRVLQGGTVVDETREPFGIRSTRFNAERGFFLNDRPLVLKGLCLHHDAGVVGAAVPDAVLWRRLQLVKRLGANAVRCSHNPMASEFYDFCDRLGLLVMDEAFDEWELGKRKWVSGRNVGTAGRAGHSEHFAEWAERDVAEMVRRGRNHPSVVLWSIGNEIDYPGDPYSHPEFFDPQAPPVDEGSPSVTRLAVVAPKLIAAVKREDPTRPVTMALSNTPASNDVGLANMLDVCGYNYQEQFYDRDHSEFPGRVIYGSETGRGTRTWEAVTERPFISGQFLWVGFDFLGEAGRWPNHGSQSGVFDTRGYLKPRGWTQKALWDDRPFVRVAVAERPARANRRPRFSAAPRLWRGERDVPTPVVVVTNCEAIELVLNDIVVPTTAAPNGIFHAAIVPYRDGALAVSGLRSGKSVAADSLRTPGPVARIALRTDRDRGVAAERDATHVHLEVVDEEGFLVPDFDGTVSVSVSGGGRLLGIDNGDQDDTTPLQHRAKTPRDGRLLVLVESLAGAGEVTVNASAKGIADATLRLASFDPSE